MALVVTDSQNYTDIADAINTKLGTSDQYYPSEMADAILSISGGGGGDIDPHTTYVQMNPIASAFLADTTYQNETYDDSNRESVNFKSSVMSSTYEPQATKIALNDPTAPAVNPTIYPNLTIPYRTDQPVPTEVTISRSGNLSLVDSKSHVMTEAIGSSGTHDIDNITPNANAYYINEYNNEIVQGGSTTGTGQIRMIRTTTYASTYHTGNVRDLGGWACDGGTIAYGKIFRGNRFSGGSVHITAEDLNTFHNLLGIKDEIDLRQATEHPEVVSSAFGDDVMYHRIPIPVSSQNYDGDLNSPLFGTLFKQIAYDLKYNLPIYLHCAAGADRTGVTCALIEGLCGVARYNIDKDYELTSLTNFISSGTIIAGNEYHRYRTGGEWKDFIVKINNSYPGNTFRDHVVSYLLSVGVTLEEINTIRQNLIDGNPEVITGYDIEYNLTNTTSSNTNTTIAPNQSYTTTISVDEGYSDLSITVTMGGTDITSTTVTGNAINIVSVTGKVVITASASIITYSVTNNLTNATTSAPSTNYVDWHQAYTATISPATDYQITLADVTITMGGVDASQYVQIQNLTAVISIPSVTGNIVIDVEASALQTTYTATYTLTNVVTTPSVPSTTIVEGDSYSLVLTPAEYYIFENDASDVTATMENGTLTKSYDSVTGAVTVSTSSITGNIAISATATANSYSVSYIFTDVNTDDGLQPSRVIKNNAFSIILTPETGCDFSTASCTMGGVDQTITDITTGDNAGKKSISIASVTGDIVITASATHVDIISNAYFSHGKKYSAVGYINNTRLTSSGGSSSSTGITTIGNTSLNNNGYIHFNSNDELHLYNILVPSSSVSNNYIALYYYDGSNMSCNIAVSKSGTYPDSIIYTSAPSNNNVAKALHNGTVSGYYVSSMEIDEYSESYSLIKLVTGNLSTSGTIFITGGQTYSYIDSSDNEITVTIPPTEYVRFCLSNPDDLVPVLYLYESSSNN